jgi:hypothetical protein
MKLVTARQKDVTLIMYTVTAIRDSSVSEQITHLQGNTVSIPCKGRDFSLRHNTTSRPALVPTQPPTQLVAGVKRPGREHRNSSHLESRLRMRAGISPLPHTSARRDSLTQGQLCRHLT